MNSNTVLQYVNLRHGLPRGLFRVGLTVNILEALLASSIKDTCPAHLNPLYLIRVTISDEWYTV